MGGSDALAETLRSSRLFEGISDEQVQKIIPLCRTLNVGKGTTIFREGESAKTIYLVRTGRAAVEMSLERPDGSTARSTVVASISPREAFGWSALVEPNVLTLSSKAMVATELVLIEGLGLRRLLDRSPRLGYRVMNNVAALLAERLADIREAFVAEREALWKRLEG